MSTTLCYNIASSLCLYIRINNYICVYIFDERGPLHNLFIRNVWCCLWNRNLETWFLYLFWIPTWKKMTLSLGGKQFINFFCHVRFQMLLQDNPEQQFQKAVSWEVEKEGISRQLLQPWGHQIAKTNTIVGHQFNLLDFQQLNLHKEDY